MSRCKPRAAGDLERFRASSSQPIGVGGIGPRVLPCCAGLLTGGAITGLAPLDNESGVRLILCDLEPFGGGPGGGGGKGIPGAQPCTGVGEFSIGVLEFGLAMPIAPVEAARRAAGARIGDSRLYWRSGRICGTWLLHVSNNVIHKEKTSRLTVVTPVAHAHNCDPERVPEPR